MTQQQAPMEPTAGSGDRVASAPARLVVWLALVLFLVALALMAWGASAH